MVAAVDMNELERVGIYVGGDDEGTDSGGTATGEYGFEEPPIASTARAANSCPSFS
jgi:hypothetical protein